MLAVAALTLAACGDDDASQDSTSTPETTVAAEDATPETTESMDDMDDMSTDTTMADDMDDMDDTAMPTTDDGASTLRAGLTSLLQEHVYLAGITIETAVDAGGDLETPAVQAAVATLDANSVALSEVVGSVAGAENGSPHALA